MANDVVPTCLQELWRTRWGLDSTILADCGSACPNPNDFISDWTLFLVNKYATTGDPERFVGGVISATHDLVIREFFGFGANECNPDLILPVAAATYEQGLLDLRALIQPRSTRFGTFFYDSVQHPTLLLNKGNGVLGGLYDTVAPGENGEDVRLLDWVTDMIERRHTSHVGP